MLLKRTLVVIALCAALVAVGIQAEEDDDAFLPGVESEDINKVEIEDEEDDGRTIDEIIRDAGTEQGASDAARANNQINMQMDMNLEPIQYAFSYTNESLSSFAGAGMKDTYWRWPKAIIPYRITRDFGSRYVNVIMGAMKEWQEKTCIRFTPAGSSLARTTGHSNYITVVNKGGCYSMVGWLHRNHEVSLRIGGCTYHGIVAHELGHTIGLHHEQCRTDRDTAIKVLLDNVPRGNRHNFNIERGTFNFGVPYDYCSVMHYGGKSFSSNGGFTVITRNQDYQGSIGHRTNPALHFTDAKIVNIMYKCNSHCEKNEACKEPCYVNHQCKCECPTPCPKKSCTSVYGSRACASNRRILGNSLITGDFGNGCGPRGCDGSGPGPTDGPKPPRPTGSGGGGGGAGDNCLNHHERCQEWADRGECDNNSRYMIPHCPKACGFCENCGDKNERCQEWADRGECENNPWYMLPHCNKACKLC